MRVRRLSLRWLPLWLERLLGLWRLRRLLLVLGFLSHLLDQILKRRAQRRESRGRVLLDPAQLSYLRRRCREKFLSNRRLAFEAIALRW
jgi:hypothetical protein